MSDWKDLRQTAAEMLKRHIVNDQLDIPGYEKELDALGVKMASSFVQQAMDFTIKKIGGDPKFSEDFQKDALRVATNEVLGAIPEKDWQREGAFSTDKDTAADYHLGLKYALGGPVLMVGSATPLHVQGTPIFTEAGLLKYNVEQAKKYPAHEKSFNGMVKNDLKFADGVVYEPNHPHQNTPHHGVTESAKATSKDTASR